MRRVGIEIVGNAMSALKAFAKVGEGAQTMGKELDGVAVKAQESAAKQVQALVATRDAIRLNIAEYAKLAKSASATKEERLAAATLMGRQQSRLGMLTPAGVEERVALRGRATGLGRAGEAINRGSLGLLGFSAGTAGAAAALFGGYESIKKASEFRSEMLLLQTQAGASAKEVDKMSGAVLRLSAQVGQSPAALAKGLYHIESYGYRGAKALNLLRLSAKGAAVGHDDIEATTNALLIMSKRGSKIGGVGGPAHAMGLLDAIIGAGNMRMPELTAALGTGVVSSAANFGVTMPQLGAAIATLTHAGQSADDAGTHLRMTFSLMAGGSAKAEKILERLGLSHIKLAKTMRTQGLGAAFKELHDALMKLPIDERSAALSHMFGGGKSSGTIMTLLQQMENFDRIQKQVTENTKRFGHSWDATQQTLTFRVQQMKAGISAGLTAAGSEITPALTRGVNSAVSYFQAHWPQIRQTARAVAADIRTVWAALWPPISRVARVAIATIVPTIRNIARVVRGVVELVKGLLHGNWHVIWLGAKNIVGGAINQMKVVLKSFVGTIRALGPAIVGIFGGIWTSVKNLTKSAFDWMEKAAIKAALKIIEPFSHIPKKILGVPVGGGGFQAIKHGLEHDLAGIDARDKKRGQQKQDENRRKTVAATLADALAHRHDYLPPLGTKAAGHTDKHVAATKKISLLTPQRSSSSVGPLIPYSLGDALLNARLTKGHGDDLKALKDEETYLQDRLAQTKKNTALYTRLMGALVSVHKQIEGMNKHDAAVKHQHAKLLGGFSTSPKFQLAEARADALAAMGTNADGPTKLQIALAHKLKTSAMKAINSHKLTMQGLIDAWSAVGQANQTLAQKASMTDTTKTYKLVSMNALTAGLNLAGSSKKLLQERISQAQAHGGARPTGPAAQGQIVHIDTVHVHGVQNVDELYGKLGKVARKRRVTR